MHDSKFDKQYEAMLKEKGLANKHKEKVVVREAANLKASELTDYVSIKIHFKSPKEEEAREKERQAAIQAKHEAQQRIKVLM